MSKHEQPSRRALASQSGRPLRIVQVVPSYFPAIRYGGPIFVIHQLGVGLTKAGHSVTVLTTNLDGPGVLDVPTHVPVAVDGVRVRYFPCTAIPRLTVSLSMAAVFAQEFANADLVHFHSVFSFPTAAGAAVARRSRVPYLVAPHGALVPELIRRRSSIKKKAWLGLFDRHTLRSATALHVTAQAEYELACAIGYALPPPMIVANGVYFPADGQTHNPSPTIRYAASRGPYVLFLGRISWKKGIDRLIRSMPKTGLRLVVAGNDEEGLIPELRQLVYDMGLSSSVDFVGAVEGDDKWYLFKMARCFALTSHNENFGNTVAEAMAVGRPVVVTDGVGAEEHVRASEGGMVVAGQIGYIHSALTTLGAQPALADKLGAKGKVYARAHLSIAANTARILENYLRITGRCSDEERTDADLTAPSSRRSGA